VLKAGGLMSMLSSDPKIGHVVHPIEQTPSPLAVWVVAILAGLSVAWPLIFAAALHGQRIMIRSLTGDSYHYLAIARKATVAHIYTYDGLHVTNGFHPLWQYAIRAVFATLQLQSHESQAIAVLLMALIATTVGVILASAAIVRLTNQYFLGLLLVPGLYYVVVGVHVRNLWIWSALDGMESAFSVLFGGVFFYVLSHHIGPAAKGVFRPVTTFRALGLVLPFLILSRLDDVFILPAFLIAVFFFEPSPKKRILAGAWVAGPSAIAVLCYLLYNKMTVGAAMPLSGATKSGFVGFVTAYLTAAIHFPPLLDLKGFLMKTPSDGLMVFANSFRFVEIIYPLLAASFGALALWQYRRKNPEHSILFAICLYIIFKMSYNFLNVHPWHQADWYYAFATLSLSVLGAMALRKPWISLRGFPIAKNGIVTVYVLLMLLSGSQYYATIVYQPEDTLTDRFWAKRDEIRKELLDHGVRGIVNVDDGITAFLLDVPNMHGFAFATDVEAQRAHQQGRMLSLAYSRGINTIAGFGYMSTDTPPHSEAEIRDYLCHSLAAGIMRAEMDQFDFSLAYYDPALKMPFISFTPNKKGKD
jgi:hypothetical protein